MISEIKKDILDKARKGELMVKRQECEAVGMNFVPSYRKADGTKVKSHCREKATMNEKDYNSGFKLGYMYYWAEEDRYGRLTNRGFARYQKIQPDDKLKYKLNPSFKKGFLDGQHKHILEFKERDKKWKTRENTELKRFVEKHSK